MAYDAATGTVVLFGGGPATKGALGDAWTWKADLDQAGARQPARPAGTEAAMAYDAATSTIVLFGGVGHRNAILGDTWTWG